MITDGYKNHHARMMQGGGFGEEDEAEAEEERKEEDQQQQQEEQEDGEEPQEEELQEEENEMLAAEVEKEGAAQSSALSTPAPMALAAATAAALEQAVVDLVSSTQQKKKADERAHANREEEKEGLQEDKSGPSSPPSLPPSRLHPHLQIKENQENEADRVSRTHSPSLRPSSPSLHHLLLPPVPPPYVPPPRPASPPSFSATDTEEGLDEQEEEEEEEEEEAPWEAVGEFLDFMIKGKKGEGRRVGGRFGKGNQEGTLRGMGERLICTNPRLPSFLSPKPLFGSSMCEAALLVPPDLLILRGFLSSSTSARRSLFFSYRSFLSRTSNLDALVQVICDLVQQARREGGLERVSVATQTGWGKEKVDCSISISSISSSSSRSSRRSSTPWRGRPPFNLFKSSYASSSASSHPSPPTTYRGAARNPSLSKSSLPPSSSSFLSLLSSLHLTPVQLRALRRALVEEDEEIMVCIKSYQETHDIDKLKADLRAAVRLVVLEGGKKGRRE